MRKRRISFALGCVVGLILIINIFLLFHFGYSRQPGEDYPFPKSGTWQCQELGITIFFDEGKCTVFDGKDMIECYVLRERGTCEVFIYCNEFNNLDYEFDHIFFSGDFLSVDGDVFYIAEHKTGLIYSFYRTAE